MLKLYPWRPVIVKSRAPSSHFSGLESQPARPVEDFRDPLNSAKIGLDRAEA